MNTSVKSFIIALLSVIIGMVLNGVIINISPLIIPPPEGADLLTPEGLMEAMKIMEPKHFIMPFLAHALGTLVAVFIAFKLMPGSKFIYAIFITFPFLLGGAYMVYLLPAPLWFEILDLALAYVPMAWIGAKMAGLKTN